MNHPPCRSSATTRSPGRVVAPVAAFLITCVLISGCRHAGSSTASPPALSGAAADSAGSADIAGTYTLVSVDGNAVPCTITHEGATLRITSGVFTIEAGGACASTMNFVPPASQEVRREVHARYARNGRRLVMQWEGAGQTVGTIAGDTFTMENEGMRLAYRRTR